MNRPYKGTPLLRRVYDQALGIRLRRTAPLHTLDTTPRNLTQRLNRAASDNARRIMSLRAILRAE